MASTVHKCAKLHQELSFTFTVLTLLVAGWLDNMAFRQSK